MRHATVKNHYSDDEFKKLFIKYKNDAIVYNRLVFIKSIKNGNTIKETAKVLDIDRRTGSDWLKKYNEYGVEGLIPNFSARGAKCRLSNEQLAELYEVITENSFGIDDAKNYISEKFEIEYSYKQVWEIMRKKLDIDYDKHLR